MISFRKVNSINFIVSVTLFFLLLVFPEPIFYLFDVEGNKSAFFICRRAAMLFGGFAVISFFTKDIQLAETRQAVSLGFAFSMSGFALMGTVEFLRGFAGGGIFFAVIGELFLAVSYGLTWLRERRTTAAGPVERAFHSGTM
jgi:hypothetical protein